MKTLISFFCILVCSFVSAKTRVAITVDDHPSHGKLPPGVTREQVTEKMLAALKKHGIPEAYAFINAGKVEVEGESLRVLELWKEAGYPLGSHTYLHKSANKISAEEFKTSIDQNEPLLKKLNGDDRWKFFRYPFLHEGDTLEKRNAIRAHLKTRGYQVAQVTIDFNDWMWNDVYARCRAQKNMKAIKWLEKSYLQRAVSELEFEKKLSQALFKRQISHVLLLHVGAFDADIMDRLFIAYKKAGVEFVTLAEAQKDEIYAVDPGYTFEWGAETTFQIMKSRGLKLEDLGLKIPEDLELVRKKLKEICPAPAA